MNDFTIKLPTQIEFGNNSVLKCGKYAKNLGGKKTIIITDKGLKQSDILGRVKKSLLDAEVVSVVFDGVRWNPRDIDIQPAVDLAIAEDIDIVVACGGGSSMDFAKAVAAMMTNRGSIQDIMKPNKVKNQPLPLICIPTTAGTGSEVTSFAVLTVASEGRKSSIFDEKIRPTVAIDDPMLLKTLPTRIAAATGMDALTHAIEAYTCRLANPLTDGVALQAIRYISGCIREFVYERSEESCYKMMAGSLLAGIAFGFSDIAGVHCMAEALGGVYDTPHGVANAIFLPIVFSYNISADIKRHRDVAESLGVSIHGRDDKEIAQLGAMWLSNLSEELKIPKLRHLKYVTEDSFEKLADLCMKNVSLKSNIRSLTQEEFLALYYQAYLL